MVNEMILRELGPSDEAAFLKWYECWKDDDPTWATFIWKPGITHQDHLQKLKDSKDPTKIPSHFVPSTMLYAFVDGVIVGRLSIRHTLNENLAKRGGHIGYSVAPPYRQKGYAREMFRQGLKVCKELGLHRILVTCKEDNEPSWRVIESFGGTLEGQVIETSENVLIRRYWLEIEKAP